MVDIQRTFGALLIGGIIAAVFSGVVTVQTFVYFKHYPLDLSGLKALVTAVWLLDTCHTVFVTMALWDHLIEHFGEASRIDFVPWSLALTIAFTAILTFLVHWFFVQRIYKLSHRNLLLVVPLAVIACLRLCFACLTTVKLITLRSLEAFVQRYAWSFTSGLALSSLLDVLITMFLGYFLVLGRKKNVDAGINHVLDRLLLYTFESGSLTCAAAVMSMICWLTMPTNLIFMGLHFVISKFYANSFLATLNTRKNLKQGYFSQPISQSDCGDRSPLNTASSRSFSLLRSKKFAPQRQGDPSKVGHVQISVEETVLSVVDNTYVNPVSHRETVRA